MNALSLVTSALITLKDTKAKKKTQYRDEHFGLANTDLLPTKISLIVRIHNIAY